MVIRKNNFISNKIVLMAKYKLLKILFQTLVKLFIAATKAEL
jgi:hypothetical protein